VIKKIWFQKCVITFFSSTVSDYFLDELRCDNGFVVMMLFEFDVIECLCLF
jgi:hypothetical protein